MIGGKEGGASAIGQLITVMMTAMAAFGIIKVLDSRHFFELVHSKDLQSHYDYIIVGGGTSGGVIAERLSADSDTTVLLIEAGMEPYDDPNMDVPILAENTWRSDWDWAYTTTPQRGAFQSHVDQAAVWPSGRGLGGSSNLNYMLYERGSRHDYDEWAANGATGWAYKDVLPYFIKSEDNRNSKFIHTVFHGYGGLLTVNDIEESPASSIAKEAFRELGVKDRDVNGRTQYGYGATQATIRRGMRWGTYRAFIKRAIGRENFHHLTNTVAQKIVFKGKRAVGVAVKIDGKEIVIYINKEVVVSAGTVGSAKLLLLSGVGPRAHLEEMDINQVIDLPVGSNLRDHVAAPAVQFYTPHSGVSVSVARSDSLLQSLRYDIFGSGLKSSPRYREGIAYVRTRFQPAHIKYPLVAFRVVARVEGDTALHLNLNASTLKTLHGNAPSKEGFSIYPTLLHPSSRGILRLRTKDPNDPPLIDPNYLTEDADMKNLVEAYQYTRHLIQTAVMSEWGMSLDPTLLPECDKYGNFTNAYVECLIRHVTVPGGSPVGTCKMGATNDVSAVVDPNLRVRGLRNLRVADAAVFPNTISANTYVAQVMLGEKAADLLRGINSVKAIQDYYAALILEKHEKIKEDELHKMPVTTCYNEQPEEE